MMESRRGAPARIGQVAVHTLKETVRDRVFLVSLLFAVLLIASSVVVSPLAAGEQDRVIKNMGLASISAIGLFLAIFVGASLVHREVERRTIYTLLSRPVSRGEYVIGKYVGIVLTLALNVGSMALLFSALVYFYLDSLSVAHIAAIYLIGVELAVVASASILFSVLSSPVLGALFTLALYFIGHLAGDIGTFAEMIPSRPAALLCKGVSTILPHLTLFDVKGMAVYGKSVEPGLLLSATLYAIGYIAPLLFLAVILFRRKDLQ